MNTYPEINAIKTVKECRAALRMGYNNFDSVKPEFQKDLKDRLDAIEDRMRRLIATGNRIKAVKGVK